MAAGLAACDLGALATAGGFFAAGALAGADAVSAADEVAPAPRLAAFVTGAATGAAIDWATAEAAGSRARPSGAAADSTPTTAGAATAAFFGARGEAFAAFAAFAGAASPNGAALPMPGTARSTLRFDGTKLSTTNVTDSPTFMNSRALRGAGWAIRRNGT